MFRREDWEMNETVFICQVIKYDTNFLWHFQHFQLKEESSKNIGLVSG